MTTTKTLTKVEEKALLRKTIAKLPDGYVRDIIADMAIEIDNAIDNDFGFVNIALRRQQTEAHAEEMRIAKEKLAILNAEIREKESDLRHLQYGLDEIRDTIRKFSNR